MFTVPREIRDKIYRLLIAKTYLVYGHPFYHQDHHRKPKVKAKADLALLRTCKAVYEEASDMLYSKAVFRFAIDYDDAENPPSPLPKRLTDRMMNVDFILNQASFDDNSRNCPELNEPAVLEPLAQATMDKFTGNKIERTTCGVLIWAVEYDDSLGYGFLSTPMAVAIANMTGFQSVVVEIEDQDVSLADSWAKANCEEGNESGSGDEYSTDEEAEAEDEDLDSNKEVMTRGVTVCTDRFSKQIHNALKPSLGPGKEGCMLNKPGFGTSLCIAFAPRKYRREKSKVSHSAV